MEKKQLLALQTDVEPLVREVGELQRLLFRSNQFKVWTKADQTDCSDIDLACERMLKDGLKKLVPEAAFFAEESGVTDYDAEYHWVIDPLDGTTNYLHGLPYFGISVALTYRHEPVCAAIYNPIAEDFFYATKGGGAYANGLQISAKKALPESQSVVIVELPYKRGSGFTDLIAQLPEMASKRFIFRHFGAAALDQAYLASGALDVTCFVKLGWWDVAAGMLLISEAGGMVTDFQGNRISYDYESYLAGAPSVHKELLELIKISQS